MKNQKKHEMKLMSLISMLLGMAAIVTTAAYIVYRVISEKAYNEKWKDYNDCGISAQIVLCLEKIR